MTRRIWFKCSCPSCGSMRIPRDRVVILISMVEQSYAFTCPNCYTTVERVATPAALKVLLDTIVFDQPPITELEVVEFVEQLNSTRFPIAELGDSA